MDEYNYFGKNLVEGMIEGARKIPFFDVSAFRNFGMCVDVETLERYGICIRSNNWRRLHGLPMRRRRKGRNDKINL